MSAAQHRPGPLTVKRYGDAPRQAHIESDHQHLAGRWVDIYVDFSGFFGSYGPDMFAAAPELLEALQAEQEWRDREAAGALDDEWDYETMVGAKRRAAIAKASGGAA